MTHKPGSISHFFVQRWKSNCGIRAVLLVPEITDFSVSFSSYDFVRIDGARPELLEREIEHAKRLTLKLKQPLIVTVVVPPGCEFARHWAHVQHLLNGLHPRNGTVHAMIVVAAPQSFTIAPSPLWPVLHLDTCGRTDFDLEQMLTQSVKELINSSRVKTKLTALHGKSLIADHFREQLYSDAFGAAGWTQPRLRALQVPPSSVLQYLEHCLGTSVANFVSAFCALALSGLTSFTQTPTFKALLAHKQISMRLAAAFEEPRAIVCEIDQRFIGDGSSYALQIYGSAWQLAEERCKFTDIVSSFNAVPNATQLFDQLTDDCFAALICHICPTLPSAGKSEFAAWIKRVGVILHSLFRSPEMIFENVFKGAAGRLLGHLSLCHRVAPEIPVREIDTQLPKAPTACLVSSFFARLIGIISDAIERFMFQSLTEAKAFFLNEFCGLVRCLNAIKCLPVLTDLKAIKPNENGVLPGFEPPREIFLFLSAVRELFVQLDPTFIHPVADKPFRSQMGAGGIISRLQRIVGEMRYALRPDADCDGAVRSAFLVYSELEHHSSLGFIDESISIRQTL
jgi:hypothetical protein